MTDKSGGYTPAMAQRRFGVGIDDVLILPLVAIALAAKKLFDATLSILIHILDYAFPILLQLARFPLFTARIIGDGVAAILKFFVGFLPVSGTRREEWREFVSRHWSWLRRKISYKAFEEAVHHAFEGGMAWVFRKCRTLTPRAALLVIFGAILWLPISFGAATAIHVVLVAKAASLPPWMQLLHPLATVIAKSKLLVLPAYPAAWPQAKKHSFVQAIFRFYRYLTTLYFMQKMGYRYGQADHVFTKSGDALGQSAARVGLDTLVRTILVGFNGLTAWIGNALRAAMTGMVQGLSRLPLIGAIVRSYAAHYDGADHQHTERFSKKVSGFFGRWSIKFSADYYEARKKPKPQKATLGRLIRQRPPAQHAQTPDQSRRSNQLGTHLLFGAPGRLLKKASQRPYKG